jgi:steroid 5-alpha reductase family enzyme
MNVMQMYTCNLLAVMAIMVAGGLYSRIGRNVTIVDVLWGMGFVLIAWLTWFQADGGAARQWLIVGAATIWGVRLSAHLVWRNHGKGEDPSLCRVVLPERQAFLVGQPVQNVSAPVSVSMGHRPGHPGRTAQCRTGPPDTA